MISIGRSHSWMIVIVSLTPVFPIVTSININTKYTFYMYENWDIKRKWKSSSSSYTLFTLQLAQCSAPSIHCLWKHSETVLRRLAALGMSAAKTVIDVLVRSAHVYYCDLTSCQWYTKFTAKCANFKFPFCYLEQCTYCCHCQLYIIVIIILHAL